LVSFNNFANLTTFLLYHLPVPDKDIETDVFKNYIFVNDYMPTFKRK